MPSALQLCPNDHPPFADICAGHAEALEQLGFGVITVFFESRTAAPVAGAVYAAPRELRAVVEDRPDLIVSHRYRAYRSGAALARSLAVPRHVAIAHEFGVFATISRRLRYRLRSRSVRLAAVSNAVAEDLRTAGVAEPALLPNPLDCVALRRGLLSRSAARAALQLPDAAFVVGVLGRLHPKKAPDRALRAFQRYRREDADAHLIFVGDGPLRTELEGGGDEGVTFAGFRADARRLLPAFDVLLSCSTEREAFGLALLEGLAAGLKVIVADQPGPRFALGDEGVYFDSDDELIEALRRHRGAPASGCRAAAAQVERFSPSALAERWRKLLGSSSAL